MSGNPGRLQELLKEIDDSDVARRAAVSEIQRAVDAFDGSATQLAKIAGVSTSTITRPLKDPRSSSLPKWATIVKILAAAGLQPKSYGGPLTAPSAMQIVEVVGEIRPGVWFEDADGRSYGDNIVLGMPRYRPQGGLSAFVVGPEGVPYPPGTKAIIDSGRFPADGEVVVFRRTRDGLIETSSAQLVEANRKMAFLRHQADGTTKRFDVANLAAEVPGLGVPMGTVIATLWMAVDKTQ